MSNAVDEMQPSFCFCQWNERVSSRCCFTIPAIYLRYREYIHATARTYIPHREYQVVIETSRFTAALELRRRRVAWFCPIWDRTGKGNPRRASVRRSCTHLRPSLSGRHTGSFLLTRKFRKTSVCACGNSLGVGKFNGNFHGCLAYEKIIGMARPSPLCTLQ